MEITEVRAHHVDGYLLIEVATDAGVTGLGESGAVGVLEASAAAVDMCGRYLVGEDPARIRHHQEVLLRSRYVRGAAWMGAVSAVDIALWDIAAQVHGVPVHRLLGGPTRDRVRVYRHVIAPARQEILTGIYAACEEGYTAVGHLSPWGDEPKTDPYLVHTHAERIDTAVEAVARYRETAGNTTDLCIEIHRRLTPAEAIVLAREIEAYRPMFLEDPVRPDNLDDTARVAHATGVPVATGERLTSPKEFAMLLTRNAVAYVRPNVGLVGGITGAMQVAALAEAHSVGVVPHSPLSPVLTAASLQVMAAIPNGPLLEYAGDEDTFPKNAMVDTPATYDGTGYLMVPTTPGLGVRFDPAGLDLVKPYHRTPVARLAYDGSVVDQ